MFIGDIEIYFVLLCSASFVQVVFISRIYLTIHSIVYGFENFPKAGEGSQEWKGFYGLLFVDQRNCSLCTAPFPSTELCRYTNPLIIIHMSEALDRNKLLGKAEKSNVAPSHYNFYILQK